jgi:hypothetical protein
MKTVVVSRECGENLVAEECTNGAGLVRNTVFFAKVFFDEVDVPFAPSLGYIALDQVLPNIMQ